MCEIANISNRFRSQEPFKLLICRSQKYLPGFLKKRLPALQCINHNAGETGGNQAGAPPYNGGAATSGSGGYQNPGPQIGGYQHPAGAAHGGAYPANGNAAGNGNYPGGSNPSCGGSYPNGGNGDARLLLLFTIHKIVYIATANSVIGITHHSSLAPKSAGSTNTNTPHRTIPRAIEMINAVFGCITDWK